MPALSEQFLLLDKMREAARVKQADWAAKAGVLWLRFLEIKSAGKEPTPAEISNLRRALEQLSDSRSPAPSKHERTGRPAPHRNGLTSDPALVRGLRIAVPVTDSGEGERG